MKPQGYLVFTTHDGDAADATFVPADNTPLIDCLRSVNSTESMEDAVETFNEWINSVYKTPAYIHWSTQTYCENPWPFNDYEILGTFYLLVY